MEKQEKKQAYEAPVAEVMIFEEKDLLSLSLGDSGSAEELPWNGGKTKNW